MADVGMDMGKSNVEKKCVPAIFPPVVLRGELGSSEVNEDLGRPALGLVGAAAFHLAVPPLSPRDESFFPFLSCRRNVPWGVREGGWRGGGNVKGIGILVLYERTYALTHATPQARQREGVARGNS